MTLIFRIRPIAWFFRKDWYSFYRFKKPSYYEGRTYKLVDLGAITVGYSYKKK